LRDNYEALRENYTAAVERYHQLTEKYTRVVRALQAQREEDSGLRLLAAWALRRSSSGFALVQGGRITIANVTFLTIEGSAPSDQPWERVDGEGAAEAGRVDRYPHLRSLALGEASRPVGAERGMLRARFARGSQVVDVSVDRTDLRGNVMVIIRDDTDLATARASATAMEEKFVQQERVRTLGGLAMGIVHDLNNILGSLAMRFDVLQKDAGYRPSQARNLDLMNQIIRSCTARVRSLHSVVRSPDPSPATVDLAEVVSSAVEIVESGFLHGMEPHQRIAVRTTLPPLPKVNGSADELRHVFINLLLNARDAMPKGGTITINGSHDGPSVSVVVEDEGPGIEPDQLDRIFEPFFTTKGANGTGVGLAIARETLEKFGGSIRATNLRSGGASFELRFVAST
jgi:signal transduction histidine kinase